MTARTTACTRTAPPAGGAAYEPGAVSSAPAVAPLPADALGAALDLLAGYGLPTGDLTAPEVKLFAIGTPARPQGIVGLEVHDRHGLLRSLAVRADAQGAGLGRALVAHVETVAREQELDALWLLTETAERFFAALGWERVARSSAPAAIRASREFTNLCPATATCLRHRLV